MDNLYGQFNTSRRNRIGDYICPICHFTYHNRNEMLNCMYMDREILNQKPPSMHAIREYRRRKEESRRYWDSQDYSPEFGHIDLEPDDADDDEFATMLYKAYCSHMDKLIEQDRQREAKEMAAREEKRVAKFIEDNVRWFCIEF